jgi:hypothetical protein
MQCAFLEELNTFMLEYVGSNLIIGGDFNITLNPKVDKKGGIEEKNLNTV